jgi:hypothetical protein
MIGKGPRADCGGDTNGVANGVDGTLIVVDVNVLPLPLPLPIVVVDDDNVVIGKR